MEIIRKKQAKQFTPILLVSRVLDPKIALLRTYFTETTKFIENQRLAVFLYYRKERITDVSKKSVYSKLRYIFRLKRNSQVQLLKIQSS